VSPGEAGQPEPRFLTSGTTPPTTRTYSAGERVPYERNQQWLGFFAGVADRIRSDIARQQRWRGLRPWLLVESLTDRGVDAHGSTFSDFAIAQVRDA